MYYPQMNSLQQNRLFLIYTLLFYITIYCIRTLIYLEQNLQKGLITNRLKEFDFQTPGTQFL